MGLKFYIECLESLNSYPRYLAYSKVYAKRDIMSFLNLSYRRFDSMFLPSASLTLCTSLSADLPIHTAHVYITPH